MKVIFMGTPDFAVPTLEHIFKEGYDIPLVVTQPDRPKGRGKKLSPPPVKIKAESLGLEVFQPKNINEEDSIKKIKRVNPDVIVVVAYGQILKVDVLNAPKKGCINVHASLLPYYRGAAPINWAIINGEKETGVTTMFMERGLDTGDMLHKALLDISKDETAGELHDRLMLLGAKTLLKTLKAIDHGQLSRQPQDHDIATYAPMMDKKLGAIDWHKKAQSIKNLVRGTNPWPTAYTHLEGKKMKLYRVDVVAKFKEGNVGEIVKVDNEGLYVNAGEDCIVIKELQFPGKRHMHISEFLKGNEISVGSRLN